MPQPLESRSAERIPDAAWDATVQRVRGEFEEMPCLRVTAVQARTLFGLSESMSVWILSRLEQDGFLEQSRTGEYTKRGASP
jgi:hypothetical protein